MTIDEAAEAFRGELLAKSPRTLKTYSAALRAFRLFLQSLKIDPATRRCQRPARGPRAPVPAQPLPRARALSRADARPRRSTRARRSAAPSRSPSAPCAPTSPPTNRFYSFLAREAYADAQPGSGAREAARHPPPLLAHHPLRRHRDHRDASITTSRAARRRASRGWRSSAGATSPWSCCWRAPACA